MAMAVAKKPSARRAAASNPPGADLGAAIVAAALEEIARVGYHGFSVANVCRAAGVANGTFYLYFRNKDALFETLASEAAHELAARLRAGRKDDEDPRAQDRHDVEVIVGFWCERGDLFRVALSEHAVSDRQRASILDMLARQRTGTLRRGVKAGWCAPDLDPALTAWAEIGMMTEVLQQWLSGALRISRAELVDQLCRLRARMLFPPAPAGTRRKS